jgi:hypothetical protein
MHMFLEVTGYIFSTLWKETIAKGLPMKGLLVAFVIPALNFLSETLYGLTMPPWLLWAAVFAVVIFSVIGTFGTKAYLAETPVLKLKFKNTPKFLPKKVPYVIQKPNGPITRNASYVKLLLENTSPTSINQCTPILLDIQKVRDNGELQDVGYADQIALKWSGENNDTLPLDLIGHMEKYIAVAFVVEKPNKLNLCLVHPTTYLANVFEAPGTYKLKVQVLAREAKSKIVEIDILWTGNCDTLSAKLIN